MRILCDFDGTITAADTIDLLLEALADEEWQVIEDSWVKGEIGSRECLDKQIRLIRGGWPAMKKVLDEKAVVTPGFVEFARWCKESNVPLVIVSDGIDKVIDYIFSKAGVRPDAIFSNRLLEHADGSVEMTFPFGADACGGGVCKCNVYAGSAAKLSIVIGDGKSDFCWARKADLVFAKKSLEKFCQKENLNYHSFDNFNDIRRRLETLHEPRANVSAACSADC
jgi:2,3-diketo-5-methylthio-1-phosphopentane phosphatase